jgi:hypothetical protein
MIIVKCHQTLHGYASGHRMLATSIPLSSKDARTLLSLSDISGPGMQIHSSGYLTGYPLPDAGLYALARTWAAPEMPRPGCVWTHTLLIDFAELASLESVHYLVHNFRRPLMDQFDDYRRPITSHLDTGDFKSESAPVPWIASVIRGLYETPEKRIVVGRGASFGFDRAVLDIWDQQWPRLKRSFRFCTLATTDRSSDGCSFDLQLYSSEDRSLRSRFKAAVEPPSASVPDIPWIGYALDDLAFPNNSGLRGFFQLFGPDLADGRAAFPVLCNLHRLLSNKVIDGSAGEKLLSLLEETPALVDSDRLVKHVASLLFERASEYPERVIRFLLCQMTSSNSASQIHYSKGFIDAAVSGDPARISQVLLAVGPDSAAGEALISRLSEDQLLSLLATASPFLESIVSARHELLAFSRFWTERTHDDIGLEVVHRVEDRSLQKRIIGAMRDAGRVDLASNLVDQVGVANFLQLIAEMTIDSEGDASSLPWIQPALHDCKQVATYLSNGHKKPFSLLFLIAKHFQPDQIPNDAGHDPWYTAAKACDMNSPDKSAEQFFYSYLLARALGVVSRSVAELFEISFEPIYHDAAVDALSLKSWVAIENRLPWSVFWLPWDRCKRLRAGLVDSFLKLHLPFATLLNIAKDDRIFEELTSQFADSTDGQRFLRNVVREVEAMKIVIPENRLAMIRRSL